MLLLLFITRGGSYQITEPLPYNVWKVVPYILVLIGALIGINVFVVLIGGIQFILNLIRRSIRGPRGAQAGIAGLSLLVDCCTANNTVAIVMAGPIAKEISSEFGISKRRTASLLDIFTSVGQDLMSVRSGQMSANGENEIAKQGEVCYNP